MFPISDVQYLAKAIDLYQHVLMLCSATAQQVKVAGQCIWQYITKEELEDFLNFMEPPYNFL